MDVTPMQQNVDKLFGTQVFEIDFYQRQYKWGKEPVEELLGDIFYKFNDEFSKHGFSDLKPQDQISKYGWYYLNTFVTTTSSGKKYVVDGQQRLTTLTLILIRLYWMAKELDAQLQDWIKGKICGQSGYEKKFWMNHEDSLRTLEALFTKGIEAEAKERSVTAKRLIENYKTVSSFLDQELNSDKRRFSMFVFYLMHRVVLVELTVNDNSDVPMVFEVINDRGVTLCPYEILKGKLLGQIKKEELKSQKFDEIWERQIDKLNMLKENDVDTFFRTYLRARFVNTESERHKFEGAYHRPMMDLETPGLNHNPQGVKKFLKENFVYYTDLYVKILQARETENSRYPAVFFNSLTRMDAQVSLILSACQVKDREEDEKIRVVSEELDRMFCLLQMQGCYESNEFARRLVSVSYEIRDLAVGLIPKVFDSAIREMIIEKKDGRRIESLWTYAFFKNVGYETKKLFVRYVLARLERYLAGNLGQNMKYSMSDLVKKTSANGFHIEHILADNDENLAKFADEETFLNERNRLGGLLLLKGADNESSGNEPYEDKLKTYVGTLIWNETLVSETYAHNLKLKHWIEEEDVNLHAMPKFGPEEIEERQRLLFDLFGRIWNARRNEAQA